MTPEHWARIEELYHAAYARPPAERAAFLADACPDDAALRRQVEALLNETQSGDAFFPQPALGMAHVIPDGASEYLTDRALGGYQIQMLIGAGGMGEVYRAHDPTLGRDVAIKVLPREFTSDANRLARFEREARMLATLNHPNICGIYAVEEVEGIRFLVLELVEGETLAARLSARTIDGRNKSLPVEDALSLARQIAEALEAAHDKGVVHRDLKPANVKITPANIVKVLDFGLAKSVVSDGSTPDLTHVPSGGQDEHRGGIFGTAAYMSPEQARGLPIDRRTDIWAFGVVLFEMIAGQVPFTGETITDTIATILKTDPDWSVLPDGVSTDLRRLLRRCLEKEPHRRLQSIGDARVHIDELLSGAADWPEPPSDRTTEAAHSTLVCTTLSRVDCCCDRDDDCRRRWPRYLPSPGRAALLLSASATRRHIARDRRGPNHFARWASACVRGLRRQRYSVALHHHDWRLCSGSPVGEYGRRLTAILVTRWWVDRVLRAGLSAHG